MNCPNCLIPMAKARATSFGEEYDYCRQCKKELSEIVKLTSISSPTITPGPFLSLVPRIIRRSDYFVIPLRSHGGTLNMAWEGNLCQTPLTPEEWLPMSHSSARFLGVNRTLDPIRLAGVILAYDMASSCEYNLAKAVHLLHREGGYPDLVILPKEQYEELRCSLGPVLQYTLLKHETTGQEWEAFRFGTVLGWTTVVQDDTLGESCYLVTMDSWRLHQNPMTGNSQLICTAPGINARMAL